MTQRNDFTDDDAEIAELLRTVGSREEPAPDMTREVQSAVHAEWRQVVAARRRRNTWTWAAAASVSAFAIGAAISVHLLDDRGTQVATLQRADGDIFLASDGDHWSRLNEGQSIAVGDYIRSDARAALQLGTGLALRMDRGTAFQVLADDRVALSVGALYVDAVPTKQSDSFAIETHAGSVRHLGTQYQVRTRVDGMDVSVREGRIVVENTAGSSIATAGEKLAVSLQGDVRRSHIAATDAQWQWASEVAPAFVIENASLTAFLDWIARETGRSIVYESSQVRSTAEGLTLHGSITGLAPDVALAAVLSTTPLKRDEANAEVIEIGFAIAIDPSPRTRPTP